MLLSESVLAALEFSFIVSLGTVRFSARGCLSSNFQILKNSPPWHPTTWFFASLSTRLLPHPCSAKTCCQVYTPPTLLRNTNLGAALATRSHNRSRTHTPIEFFIILFFIFRLDLSTPLPVKSPGRFHTVEYCLTSFLVLSNTSRNSLFSPPPLPSSSPRSPYAHTQRHTSGTCSVPFQPDRCTFIFCCTRPPIHTSSYPSSCGPNHIHSHPAELPRLKKRSRQLKIQSNCSVTTAKTQKALWRPVPESTLIAMDPVIRTASPYPDPTIKGPRSVLQARRPDLRRSMSHFFLAGIYTHPSCRVCAGCILLRC